LELHAGEATDSDPGVFTFSADTDGSHPPTPAGREEGGGLSTVSAENVKTADVLDQVPSPLPLNFGIFGDDEEWGMGTA
jgi:hypothetical protein